MLLAGGPGEDVKIAVTRLRSDVGMNERTTVPAREGAFSIHLHMRDSPNHQLWLKGKKVFEGGYRSGTTSLVNLEEEPAARIGNPFDFLQVYVPSGSLDDVAADLGKPPVRELVWPRGGEDAAAAGIARLLVQAMESERSNTLFAEQILLALRVHVVNTYGAASAARPRTGGGLAAWQERRAKDILESRFAESISIADLARECGLSPSHFTRAFRLSTGMQPYRWLSQTRIAAAKRHLVESDLPLAEIALVCGFGDQSYFTRMFTREVGAPPGVWRRGYRN